MDQLNLAEDLQDVKDQVAILNARGQQITQEEVIQNTLKRGLQEMVDHRADGSYYTVKWSDAQDLAVFDIYQDLVGTVQPQGNSFVEDFETNAQMVWNRFEKESLRLVGR